MIARPMIMKAKLSNSAWGHAVLHATTLIRIKPTSHHTYSPLQLVFGQEPNISHLRIFGCVVFRAINGRFILARFAVCHFDESTDSTLEGDKKQLGSEISWNELSLSHLDPRTKECEQKFQRIIHLQRLVNQLPDVFTDLKRVTKSHIPAANALVKIDVPKEHSKIANESKACLKRGRPIGSKDKNPRKKKGAYNQDGQDEVKDTLEGSSLRTLHMTVQEEPRVPKNEEISINYVMSRKIWNQNEIDIDDTFAYNVALEVIENDEDHEPNALGGTRISQRPGIDYEETYSPVVDATTFRYLICLVIQEGLDLRLMDVVTAYFYGSLDTEIFMKLLDGFKVPESWELPKAVGYLKKEFEMKDLGKTKFCLGLQIEHLTDGILIH
ncbi:retrovirus-related pol polyprotein from transposon TNT 1-94 [Tanacetum coccineum]